MQTIFKSKATQVSLPLNDNFETKGKQDMRTLTNEEILAVAGGPEVDVEAGAGGG